MNSFWKGLIMAIVGFAATTIADLETFNLAYVVITTVAFTLLYIGKNYWLPSNSDTGKLNGQDVLSGILIAVSMALSNFAAVLLTSATLDWKQLGLAVVGAIVGYFIKTTPAKSK